MKNYFGKMLEGNDNFTLSKGFISKEKILKEISEEEIFKYIFGEIPELDKEYCSPFRTDNSPGCSFTYYNGRLRFIDFASFNRGIDCFEAIKIYFNLPSFFKTLEFIQKNIKSDTEIKKRKCDLEKKEQVRKDTKILIATRDLNKEDKRYWDQYGITSKQLKKDGVFAVKQLKIIGKKISNIQVKTKTYAYTDFKDNRKKIYTPYAKNFKFITNLRANDIGGINHLEYNKDHLYITKAYKDYRILKNEKLNVIWFQNEGMFPDEETLTPILKKYKKVTIIFDNDRAGKEAAFKLKEYLDNYLLPLKVYSVTVPETNLKIKDPSDLYQRNKEGFNEFIENLKWE